MIVSERQANAIYTVLVNEAGAEEASTFRQRFVQYLSTDEAFEYREFRFCGKLGFGGKCNVDVHRRKCSVYVSCYWEDETCERRQIIHRCNSMIKEIMDRGTQ